MKLRFGFTSSVPARLAAVALYAVVAVIAVRWVEARASHATERASQPEVSVQKETTEFQIHLTSTFEVEEWTVRLNGEPIEPLTTTANEWTATAIGTINQNPEHKRRAQTSIGELLIEATGADYFAETPEAIRVVIEVDGGKIERTIWGKGTISELVVIE